MIFWRKQIDAGEEKTRETEHKHDLLPGDSVGKSELDGDDRLGLA
jgi:hypothetical protein